MEFNKKQIIWGFVGVVLLAVILGIWDYSGASHLSSGFGGGERAMDEMLSISSMPAPTAVAFKMDGDSFYISNDSDLVQAEDRMVVKNGSMAMVVTELDSSMKAIGNFATENGGWIVNSYLFNNEELPRASIQVRVPSETFDAALAYYRSLAVKVTSENASGEDVTKQYTDLDSRLTNLIASESQLLKIMDRAGKVSEVLEVQRELSNVRGQIEMIKGQMKYLENSVAMSSINVELALSENLLPVPASETWRPGYVLKTAWKSLLNAFKGLSYLLIKLAVYALIWVPLLLIAWWIYRSAKKRSSGGKKK